MVGGAFADLTRRVQRLDRRWLWLVVAVLALLLGMDLMRVWRITNHHDLDVFMLAARRMAAGEDIYQDAPAFKASIEAGTFSMKDNTVVWPYAYAPLIALLFVPATALPYPLVQGLWWALNVLALLLGSWLIIRAVGPVTPGRLILALALLIRFEPAVVTLRLGQIELMQFLLLALTLYALSRGREGWGGVALGVAVGIKFFPAALVALLLWRRRMCAAAWAIGTALVAVVGSFAVVGLGVIPDYLRYTAMYGIGGAFAAFPLNQSLNGFFSRNLIHNVFSPTLKGLNRPGLAKGLILGCDALIVAGTAWLAWERATWPATPQAEDKWRFALQYALGVVGLLLISPHAQVYAFVWVLLPLLVLGLWLMARKVTRLWPWGGLVLVYLLLGRNYVFFFPGVTRFVQSHYLWGALGLWGLLGAVLLREMRPKVMEHHEAAQTGHGTVNQS